MFSLSAASISLALLFTTGVSAQSSIAELVAQIRNAPTEVDRFRLLNDSDFLFSFTDPAANAEVTTGSAGRTVSATSENFAAVVSNGVSMTVGFLGPCGMNTPHTHPRASEINFSLNTTLRGGVLVENGARFAEIDIAPGSATVFPQGAIHFEMNPSCEPAMFVAAFNNEDPGVSQVAQRYFGLPPDIVGATLGGLGVQYVAGLEAIIPDNVAYGAEECLQRCNITRPTQPTAQQQPRVSANAFPAGVSTVLPPGFGPSSAAAAPSSAAAASSARPTSTAAASSARPTTTAAAVPSSLPAAVAGSATPQPASGAATPTSTYYSYSSYAAAPAAPSAAYPPYSGPSSGPNYQGEGGDDGITIIIDGNGVTEINNSGEADYAW